MILFMNATLQILAAILLCLSWCAATGAAEISDPQHSVAASGQGYFPVALRLADGRIAVVMRGGAPHLGIKGRLDMVFSADEGKTWSTPSLVVDTPIDDRNPAFGQAKDGTLVVSFFRTSRYDAAGKYNDHLDKPVDAMVTRSADGKSWSTPELIDVSDIGWGSPYGRMLTLADGTMLMDVYGGPIRKAGEKVNDRESHSYLFRSGDNGKTWTRFSDIGGKGFNETGVVQLASGEFLAAMRSDPAAEVWLASSKDGGKTWTAPRKFTPPAVHPADLMILPDGRVIMVCGYRVGPFGVVGMIGDAAGIFDWEKHFTLVDNAASGDCGYPSSVMLKDGRVLTVYYVAARKGAREKTAECGVVTFKVEAAK
jgi:hypothetical protein